MEKIDRRKAFRSLLGLPLIATGTAKPPKVETAGGFNPPSHCMKCGMALYYPGPNPGTQLRRIICCSSYLEEGCENRWPWIQDGPVVVGRVSKEVREAINEYHRLYDTMPRHYLGLSSEEEKANEIHMQKMQAVSHFIFRQVYG